MNNDPVSKFDSEKASDLLVSSQTKQDESNRGPWETPEVIKLDIKRSLSATGPVTEGGGRNTFPM